MKLPELSELSFSALFKIIGGEPKFFSAEKYLKGSPRPYLEAKSLVVIDQCIAELVEAMNFPPLIHTTGSCEGHGWCFIKASPYVAFKCPSSVAAAFEATLRSDAYSVRPKLNYFWQLTAYFDQDLELTYALEVPGISSGKWFYATRKGLDHDFKLIKSWFHQDVLHHLDRQQVEFKC